jgi:predicted CoA-binding protein
LTKPLPTSQATDEELEGRALQDRVSQLLSPRSVAVIGASSQPTTIGGLILRLLKRFKFPEQNFPINPNHLSIDGLRCYSSIAGVDTDLPIDLAVIYLPARKVLETVAECGRRGLRSLVVITAGFAETGEKGKALQPELARLTKSYGMLCTDQTAARRRSTGRPLVADTIGQPLRGGFSRRQNHSGQALRSHALGDDLLHLLQFVPAHGEYPFYRRNHSHTGISGPRFTQRIGHPPRPPSLRARRLSSLLTGSMIRASTKCRNVVPARRVLEPSIW